MKRIKLNAIILFITLFSISSIPQAMGFTCLKKKQVLNLIMSVNDTWQANKSYTVNAFWDNAAYHTGNMEVYKLTKHEPYRQYSENWARHNQWMGATSNDTARWRLSYGETPLHVLFGDWQICFQTYIDLYNLDMVKDETKVARAKGVMSYQMTTPRNDYWWWADGLYIVMPVMTKLYNLTGDQRYLDKLGEYFRFADELMYDEEVGLYYRDGKYVFPKEPTINGLKNFWSRGNGWVYAAFAKILTDLPADSPLRPLFTERFLSMSKALKKTQQAEGYWTRTLLDPAHAPGPETSGTAFFTYGLYWGMNYGLLSEKDYLPMAKKAWKYLSKTALQKDNTIGYVQPIGENASPKTTVSATSSSNFGTGAWLLAACEVYRSF
ncbi:MAG: Unsaturated rhamnogalacturonyl hydrolase YteR [Bacteroidetes bacterium ADurb.Bin416]|nr:MAG: Unsaturated rhamnogalacturonyl hydrolase YteR [Bacteroidetes bacterium ADurb.Bin416]